MAGLKRGPTGSSHYSRNDRTLRQNMIASKNWVGRNVKPNIKGSLAPKVGVRWVENYKTAHEKG